MLHRMASGRKRVPLRPNTGGMQCHVSTCPPHQRSSAAVPPRTEGSSTAPVHQRSTEGSCSATVPPRTKGSSSGSVHQRSIYVIHYSDCFSLVSLGSQIDKMFRKYHLFFSKCTQEADTQYIILGPAAPRAPRAASADQCTCAPY